MNQPPLHDGDAAAAFVDSTALAAERALHRSQRALHQGLDALSTGVDDASQRAGGAYDALASEAQDLKRRGLGALHDSSQYLREQASRMSDSTVRYIQREPVRSVLIAAGVGAGLMLLATALTRQAGARR